FPFLLVTQSRPLHLHFAVGELDATRLRSVEPDIASGFARRSRAGHLLGAQHQNLFQHLVSQFMDHALDDLAGILDEVHDEKQDLSVGLAELLDNGGRLARSAGHDVIRFLHGGRLLSEFLFGNRILSNRQPTAAYQPSTRLGTSSFPRHRAYPVSSVQRGSRCRFHSQHLPAPLLEGSLAPVRVGSGRERFPVWSETESTPALRSFSAAGGLQSKTAAGTGGTPPACSPFP